MDKIDIEQYAVASCIEKYNGEYELRNDET